MTSRSLKNGSLLKFSKGEQVLFFDGTIIYNAKVIYAVVTKNISSLYYIKYKGFNRSYNKWVHEGQLQKGKNLKKKAALRQRVARRRHFMFQLENSDSSSEEDLDAAEREGEGSYSSSGETSLSSVTKAFVTTLTLGTTKIKVDLPYDLKTIIIIDGDMITMHRKLLILPAPFTVDKILNEYVSFVNESRGKYDLMTAKICKAMKKYFNTLLPSRLLYKLERKQYNNILKNMPGVPMSKIYGSVHLLRLFTKLAGILNRRNLDSRTVHAVQQNIDEFLNYFVKNREVLFELSLYTD